MKTAEYWQQRGLHFQDLSGGADSSEEYQDAIACAQQAFALQRRLKAGLSTADDWCAHAVGVLAFSQAGTSGLLFNLPAEIRGHLADAIEAFDQALSIDPSHHKALRARGFTLAQLDQPEAALDSFVAAASQQPDDADLLLAVARELVKLGQFERALGTFDEVLELRLVDEDASLGRARVLVALGRDEVALAAWDQVLLQGDHPRLGYPDPRRPRWTEAVLARASILEKLGRPESSAAYTLLIEAVANEFFPREEYDKALKTSEIARDVYRRHLETRMGERSAMQIAASAWLRAGRPVEAQTAANALLAVDPKDPDAWFWKGEAHSQASQFGAAAAAYKKALVFRPDFSHAAAQLKKIGTR